MGFDDVILAKYNEYSKAITCTRQNYGIVDGSSVVLIGSEKAGNDLDSHRVRVLLQRQSSRRIPSSC